MALTRIFLLRHADVENPRRVLYGHLPDFPLSKLGRDQAAAVGRRLRGSGLSLIVHSPLDRARETAEIISAEQEQPVPLRAEPQLREAEFSRYLQGVPFWQIPARRPLWWVHKARRGLLPGDETVAGMGGRVLEVMWRLAAERPGQATALVSHADPLQAAWILLDGRPHREREMYRKAVDRAGALEIDIEGDQIRRLEYVRAPTLDGAGSAPPAASA